jgi:sulfur-carrier protein adenylyltransferase/sulfurtransferase
VLAILPDRLAEVPSVHTPVETGACARIFASARWAPNGDNMQTWRFQVLGAHSGRIYTWDTSDHVPYDYRGMATRLSLGMLFENIRIAASSEGLRADIRRDGGDDQHAEFSLDLLSDHDLRPDLLLPWLTQRATNRGWLSTRTLPTETIAVLEKAASPLRLRWFTGFGGRLQMARLLFAHARVRLRAKELWQVHRQIIDWEHVLSPDRVPAASLPVDPVLRRVMGWAMARWERLAAMNRWMAGDLMPACELDLLPALRCAAHVVFVAPRPGSSFAGQLAAGACVQRFWLAATSLGLQLQPSYTPIAFHAWAAAGEQFSSDPWVAHAVQAMAERWRGTLGDDVRRTVFAMRLGFGAAPRSRSVRLPLAQLLRQTP